MTRSHVRLLALLAVVAVALFPAACGRDSLLSPGATAPLRVSVHTAPRSPSAPAVGAVDSLRFDLRGPHGELLVHPTRLEVGDGQTTFNVSLAVPTGPDRSITVMGIGDRAVLGGAPETGHGVLFLGRTEGIEVKAGDIGTIPVELHLFVPEIVAVETSAVNPNHTIRWGRISGVDRYVLTRMPPGSAPTDSTVRDTSFVGYVRPMRYRVTAVDFSGLKSAPGDWVSVQDGIAPALCVTPGQIDFGTSLDAATFAITNCGTGGRIDWTVAKSIPWLDVDVSSGTTTSETDTIHVTVDRSYLTPGPHSGMITVSSNAGNQTVNVSLTIPAVPALCVSVSSLDFPADVTALIFRITNCGTGGTVTWSVSDNATWMTALPTNGTTTLESDPVTVTVDRSGLAAGSYSGQVTVESDAGSEVVSVSMDVPATPQLCVDPEPLDFGAQFNTRDLFIRNCGDGGTVSWTASDDQPWILPAASSGSVTESEVDTLAIAVDRAGLSPGVHLGHVTVTSGAGTRIVDVTLLIPAVPALCVSPPSLDFGPDHVTLPFSVTNCGTGGALDWTVDDDQPWISALPAGGSTTTGSDPVSVTVDRTGLAPGVHTGTLTVMSNGGTKMISVSLTVPAVPELCVAPPGLSFGANLLSLPIQITNCGTGGTFDWTVADSRPWVAEAPNSGSTTSETDIVTVTVDRAGLAAGVYTDTLTVQSTAGTIRVPVVMNVPAVPALCLTTHTLDFGANVTQRSFGVTNCGNGGNLNWNASPNRFWIDPVPTSGVSTGETDGVQVTVDRSQLPPGNYSGLIIVSSNAGTDTVTALIQVPNPGPVLCLSRKNLDFGSISTTDGFSIRNCGGSTLSWSTDFNVPWIQLSPNTGTTTTESDSLVVHVDRSNLGQGTHTGTIFVNSNGGNSTVDVSVTVAGSPPAPPQGLTASQLPGNPSKVHLSWNFVPPDADGLKVERELVTTGIFVEIATILPDAPGFDDTLPECGEYIYRIRAYNAAGFSDYSNTTDPILWACLSAR